MVQDTRWKQRLDNFERAFLFLTKAVEKGELSKLEAAGLVQTFEFCFELSWKTLKDYMGEQGILLSFPRDVLKKAFQNELIEDGHCWLEMLEKRNSLFHTYNEAEAETGTRLICDRYFPAIKQLYHTLKALT